MAPRSKEIIKSCCKVKLYNTFMIGCMAKNSRKHCPGKGYYHIECVHMTKEEMDTIDRYICNFCSLRTGEMTTYKETENTPLVPSNLNQDNTMDIDDDDNNQELNNDNTNSGMDIEKDQSNGNDNSVIAANSALGNSDLNQSNAMEISSNDNNQEANNGLTSNNNPTETNKENDQPNVNTNSVTETTNLSQNDTMNNGNNDSQENNKNISEMEKDDNQSDGESDTTSTTSSEGKEEEVDEYDVKQIHSWHYNPEDTKGIEYLIEYDGYPEKKDWQWQYEQDLKACYDLVDKFRRTLPAGCPIPPTTLKPIGGADRSYKTREHNLENWVSIGDLFNTAQHFLAKPRFSTSLETVAYHVSEFKKPEKDSIIFLLLNSHYYCILWLITDNLIFIADSLNLCLEESKLNEIETITKSKLTPIKTYKKSKIDYCASTTIVTALEYARMYKANDLTIDKITPPEYLFEQLVKKLHPKPSAPEEGRRDIRTINRVQKCLKCNAFSTTKGRGALLSHQRQTKCLSAAKQ